MDVREGLVVGLLAHFLNPRTALLELTGQAVPVDQPADEEPPEVVRFLKQIQHRLPTERILELVRQQAIRLRQDGWSLSAIAAVLGLNRKTVTGALREAGCVGTSPPDFGVDPETIRRELTRAGAKMRTRRG